MLNTSTTSPFGILRFQLSFMGLAFSSVFAKLDTTFYLSFDRKCTSTHLWTDPWMEIGRLIDQYGLRPSYDLGLGLKILVSDYTQDGTWHFPVRRSAILQDIWGHITTEVYLAIDYPNEII